MPAPARIVSIDLWRGINIMFVISSHLFFGLRAFDITSTDAMIGDPFAMVFGLFGSIGQMFFFLSGCSQLLSMESQLSRKVSVKRIISRELKKGMILIIVGMVYDTVVFWHLGVVDALHAIGASYIVIALLYRPVLEAKTSSYKTSYQRLESARRLMVRLGILVLILSPVMRVLVGYPVYHPEVESLILCVPPGFDDPFSFVQAWITTSFFPVFPCMAYFFFGAWFGLTLHVAVRTGNREVKYLATRMIKIGVVIMVASIILILAGEEMILGEQILPDTAFPENWWAVELSFNIQPITTSAFLFYLGMNMLAIGILSLVHDVVHDDRTARRISKIHYWFKFDLATNTWVRFSYYSFTVYILQYTWIPVLRVIHVVTGEQLLYSMNDSLHVTVIIVVAWVGFAYLVKALNTARGNRFTFERLLSRATK